MNNFDYSRPIHLDAEVLCEMGMLNKYNTVLPKLKKFVKPEEMIEIHPEDSDDYFISIGGTVYPVYIHGKHDVVACSENATYVFFHVVNKQLSNAEETFFALYSGHDLHGVFLTSDEFRKLKQQNSNNEHEWPYIPKEPLLE